MRTYAKMGALKEVSLDGEHYHTIEEIADLLRVHVQTVRRWINEGELRAVALGRRAGFRVRASDLEAFLAARDTAAEKGKAAPLAV